MPAGGGESNLGAGAQVDWKRYENLSFDAFRQLALDPSLSPSERIGCPDCLRAGAEEQILESISDALGLRSSTGLLVLDIGVGCGDLAFRMIELCREQEHRLFLVDSEEVLGHLPEDPVVRKRPGFFPDVPELLEEGRGRINAVVVYSVIHYTFVEGNVWAFVDAVLALLAPGGRALIGDIPNVSKRKRFFSSERGIAFHQAFMDTDEAPEVSYNTIEEGRIDDAVVLGIVARARAEGFDAYVLPQPDGLPMANRREDLLIRRP